MGETAFIMECLSHLTLEEKIILLSGSDFFSTTAIRRLGISAIKLADGVNGVKRPFDMHGQSTSVSFPSTTVRQSTVNKGTIKFYSSDLLLGSRSLFRIRSNLLTVSWLNMESRTSGKNGKIISYRGPRKGRCCHSRSDRQHSSRPSRRKKFRMFQRRSPAHWTTRCCFDQRHSEWRSSGLSKTFPL